MPESSSGKKKLESFVTDFIWNGKNPRFRKDIIEAEVKEGGMKLHNLLLFSKCLKISRMRRLESSTGNWTYIPREIGIDKCIFLGSKYTEDLHKKMINLFWKSILESILKLQTEIKPKNTEDLVQIPLWFCKEIGNLAFQNWSKKGIVIIADVLSQEGEILQQNEMENIYNIMANFLEFGRFKFQIEKISVKILINQRPIEKFWTTSQYLLQYHHQHR